MSSMILRLPAVKTRTGLSRSTIYQRIAEGRFPEPVSLGGRAVGWIDIEVDAWISAQIAKSRGKAQASEDESRSQDCGGIR
jgi:prophage regulatory protein